MGFARCRLCGRLFILVVVAAAGCARREAPAEAARCFIPGPVGIEPGKSTLAENAIPSESRAMFLTRALGGVDDEWGRRNRLTQSLAFSHHLSSVFPPALFPVHPEFFPLLEGKRSLSPAGRLSAWNPDLGRPDVARYAAAAAENAFRAEPKEPSFALGVNDSLTFGESPETLALTTPVRWFRERPDYSNLVFTFMNRAAEELSRSQPNKYLGALAYYWAENAPDFPLHPQVIPFLTADRAQGYDAKFRQEESELQEQWVKRAGPARESEPPRRLGLYDYLYGHGFLIPRIHPALLAENLRRAHRLGFTDYYAEMTPNWGLDGPMPWLTAQLLLDPAQSEKQLLDEYYRRYFQAAAAPMRRFFERCEEQWMTQAGPGYWLKHFRNESQADLFPAETCVALRALLDEARQLAAPNPKLRVRVGLVSEAFGVTERFVIFSEARVRLTRLVLAETGAAEPLAAALASYLTARRDFIRYTVKLKHASPLAVARFVWDDYLKNDPTPAALLALRNTRGSVSAPVMLQGDPSVTVLWSAMLSTNAGAEKERVRNGNLSGALLPGRRIAELDYGVSLPGEWFSQVEPVQFHRAEWIEQGGGGRMLRISRTKDAAVAQWNPIGGAGLHCASVSVRGHVSAGTVVSLTFGWLDGAQRHLGVKTARLPEGDFPNWVSLQQAGLPPAGAAWVGVGVRIQNQVAGDWVEIRDFSLTTE